MFVYSVTRSRRSPSKISETYIYIYICNRALINAHCFTNFPPTSHQTRARPLINRPIWQDGEGRRRGSTRSSLVNRRPINPLPEERPSKLRLSARPGPISRPETHRQGRNTAKSERKQKNWKWVSERASERANEWVSEWVRREREIERERERSEGQREKERGTKGERKGRNNSWLVQKRVGNKQRLL